MQYAHQQQARRVQKRRIQCNGETVCKTSGWSCWAVRRGLVWQWPSRQRRRERASLSRPVVRNEFRKPLNQSGGEAQGQAVDVSDERAVATFFCKLGAFDHLVFTAGDNLHLHDLAATDLQQARRAFELRYWAALAAVKYGSSHIRKEGSIVLTTGIAGRRPEKGWVIAASVCGTIEALTRALAVELAPIRVNAVSPGVVRTNLWQNLGAAERERLYESVGKSLPVGRVGEAHDVAQAYLFLMQEGFSTGQTVVVDGGTALV